MYKKEIQKHRNLPSTDFRSGREDGYVIYAFTKYTSVY